MSRIGILTFLHNGNYGSSLQAYALQSVIAGMGYSCEHMDYRPDTREKMVNMLRCGNSPKLLVDGWRKRKVRGSQAGMRDKMRLIDAFYEKHMKRSRPCASKKELEALSGEYGILICGSDQIWNPVWMNPAYFLDFGDPAKPRIAYAPSLGIRTAPGRRKSRMIRRMLAVFDAVSVREEEGAKLLVTITGDRPKVLPDPVCLLDRSAWEEIAEGKPEGAPYLLCYFIGENPAYWEKVQKIAEETGLRPLVIPVNADAYAQPFDRLDGAGPEAFLGAVRGAEMICTDSFHGLVFGTIFEKKTELIRRYREDDPESKNSRVDHFLREVREKGLTEMRREGRSWLETQLRQAEETLSMKAPEAV